MGRVRWACFTLGWFGTLLGVYACSNQGDDCQANLDCGPAEQASTGGGGGGQSGLGGDAGTTGSNAGSTAGGTAGNAGANGGCDSSKSPAEAACLIDDAHGVFVSKSAAPGGTGTREAPFQSITDALAVAAKDKKNIYVCADAGTYTEHVSFDKLLDGHGIYGGFIDCAEPGKYAWKYDAARRALIESPEPEGFSIDGVTAGMVLENLDFSASSAVTPGASSYGAFITNSQEVKLIRVKINAGSGAKGKDGSDGTTGEDGALVASAKPAANGLCTSPPSQQLGGAWAADSVCAAGGGSRGGQGGSGFNKSTYSVQQDGFAGARTPAQPEADKENGGNGGGKLQADGEPEDGGNGSRGIAGTNGGPAAEIGTFVPAYTPASGNAGISGSPGQGGGGGGASKGTATCVGASGGVGGMGGCGGRFGTKGDGGGASIGLLSSNSTVTLTACEIAAGTGGKGGKGGNAGGGGLGRDGGSGGSGLGTVLSAGRGGRGGDGGPGGSGSGGSGGPSLAVAYTGGVTWTAETQLTHADGGDPGEGGTVGGISDANPAPKGQKGKSAASFQIVVSN